MPAAVTVGGLVINLSADVASLRTDMGSATGVVQSSAQTMINSMHGISDSSDRATNAGQRLVDQLKNEIATFGMSSNQLLQHKANINGVGAEVQELTARLARMHQTEQALAASVGDANSALAGHGEELKKAAGHAEEMGFSTAGAKRELLVLTHELSQGNFKKAAGSLMVLGERTGAAGLLFSVAGIAAIGLAGAVGTLAYAVIKGISEQKEMSDALIMTGNYAGATSDSLTALARSAAVTGGSIGEAKKAVTELAASGKYTSEQIGYITSAAVALEHATGQSIEKTIEAFDSLAVQGFGNSTRATDEVSKAALKLDDQYHFLTESVYEQIRALEKEGDAKAASALATKTFADETHKRAEESIKNVGYIAAAWRDVKHAVGEAVDSVSDWGKKATAASEVDRLTKAIQQPNMLPGVYNDATRDAALAQAKQQLAKAQADLNKETGEAAKISAKTIANNEAEHAAQRIMSDDTRLAKKGMSELQVALREYGEDLAKVSAANPTSHLLDQEVVNSHTEAIIKAHTEIAKGNDVRMKLLQDDLVNQRAVFADETSIYDARDKMLALYHQKFGTSDDEFYSGRESARAEYIASEAISYAKEASLILGFNAKTPEEVVSRKKMYDELTKAHQEFINKMNTQGGADSAQQAADLQKQFDDMATAIAKSGDSELKSLDAAIAKQREHNEEIGKTREQIELARAAKVEAASIELQAEDDAIRSLLTESDLQDVLQGQYRAAYEERLAYLDRIIEKRKQEASLHEVGAGLESTDAANKAAAAASKRLADMAIQDWKNVGTSIADSLSTAFGKGGKAIGEMFKIYADNNAIQLKLIKEMGIARQLADTDPTKARQIDDIQRASAQAQIKSYADIADAAQNYFDAGSKGYQVIGAVSKTLHVAEMAMNAEKIISGVAAGAAQMFGQSGWGGFAGVAAMAAVMAGLGVAISGGGSGGKSAAEVQKTQGQGGVFGDSQAKSDSIARAIELTSKNSGIELSHTAGMLDALRAIQNSIGGLANLVIRNTGVIDGSNLGIKTGTLSKEGGMSAISGQSAMYAVGGLIGGITNTLMSKVASIWGSVKQSIVDSGIQYGGKVGDLEGGKGFNQYASVDTTTSSWFGLAKKVTNSTQTQGLSNELTAQFSLIFKNLETSLKTAAVGLGVGADQVSTALNNLVIDTTSVSLKGLTGTALTDALNNVISKTMDQMAQAAFPAFDQFRKVGEGYAETVVRVSADYANLDAIMQSIGTTFGATGVASLAARENFIDMVGGIDALSTKTKSFSDNFLTEAEKLAPVQAYVTQQLAALGLSSITTRDQFKATILAIDKTTEAGQKQYSAMLNLSDAFAQTHAAAVDLTKSMQAIADERKNLQDQLDGLTMSSAELLKKQRDALDSSNQGLFDQIQAINSQKDAEKKAADAAKSSTDVATANATAANAAVTSLGNAFLASMNAATAAAEALRSFNDSLKLGNLSSLSKSQQYDIAKHQYETADAAHLQSAATAFLQASKARGGSALDYARDFAAVSEGISAGANRADASAASSATAFRNIQASQQAQMEAQAAKSPLLGAQIFDSSVWGRGSLTGADGSHAGGLDYVPFNGYRALLHKDEGVLTADENKEYRSGRASNVMTESTAQRILQELGQVAKHARTTADMLVRVTKNGNSLQTTAA